VKRARSELTGGKKGSTDCSTSADETGLSSAGGLTGGAGAGSSFFTWIELTSLTVRDGGVGA